MSIFRFLIFGIVTILLFGCSDKAAFKTINPNASYFYPLLSEPKIYLYRNITNGLEEQFHRIYTITDMAGEHLIVERYDSEGRILEAINYNVDSLSVLDHMVVNRLQQKEKAMLYKNHLFPMNLSQEIWFASKFSGLTDSTVILYEIKRKLLKQKLITSLEKKRKTLIFKDNLIITTLNPYTRKEYPIQTEMFSYFAEGLGFVEWHSKDKKVHFRLEKILSQDEWIKIIRR
jgi:hypothetical protein